MTLPRLLLVLTLLTSVVACGSSEPAEITPADPELVDAGAPLLHRTTWSSSRVEGTISWSLLL